MRTWGEVRRDTFSVSRRSPVNLNPPTLCCLRGKVFWNMCAKNMECGICALKKSTSFVLIKHNWEKYENQFISIANLINYGPKIDGTPPTWSDKSGWGYCPWGRPRKRLVATLSQGGFLLHAPETPGSKDFILFLEVRILCFLTQTINWQIKLDICNKNVR